MVACEFVAKEADQQGTHDLLDDLAGGVQVNETLVDLELVAVPGLGTLTARLNQSISTALNRESRHYAPSCGW